MTLARWRPEHGWNIQELSDQTKALRAALLPMGVLLPECLPGEKEDCGLPVHEHYATYLGVLQARVVVLAERNLSSPEDASTYTDALEHFTGEYRAEVAQPGS